MLLSIVWAALRRRPFSFLCTFILGVIWAALWGMPVPAALLVWGVTALLMIEGCIVIEPAILEHHGCRVPTPGERVRLDTATARLGIAIRIVDESAPWIGSGLRTIIVSRGMLDLLDDQSLLSVLTQATKQQRDGGTLREIVVWLGNAPLLAMWTVTGLLEVIGRLIALAMASVLVVPLLVGPAGFMRWVGKFFGWLIILFLGASLISGGAAGSGLMLWLARLLVPGVRALLAWEARRAEADADRATGCEQPAISNALEQLNFAERVRPRFPLGLVVHHGATCAQRLHRLSRTTPTAAA